MSYNKQYNLYYSSLEFGNILALKGIIASVFARFKMHIKNTWNLGPTGVPRNYVIIMGILDMTIPIMPHLSNQTDSKW